MKSCNVVLKLELLGERGKNNCHNYSKFVKITTLLYKVNMGFSSRYGKTKTRKRRGFCKRTYASAKNKVQEHQVENRTEQPESESILNPWTPL